MMHRFISVANQWPKAKQIVTEEKIYFQNHSCGLDDSTTSKIDLGKKGLYV